MVRPASITADRKTKKLTIEWSDGHESIYSFAGLRAVCPCVECKGGHAHMGGPPDPRMVRDAEDTDLTMNRIEQVGGYALQFFWSDGHTTGIYTWSMLRDACPCSECLGDEHLA